MESGKQGDGFDQMILCAGASQRISIFDMDSTSRIELIEKSKSVYNNPLLGKSFELTSLHKECLRRQGTEHFASDIYPVRAISILEVYTRGWAARIADHSPTFAQRAIPAIQNFKPDYGLLISIIGKRITFGDIVGFAISVNRLEQIISIFSLLCGKDIVPLLKLAVDRWENEVHGKPARPIIADYDATAASVSALFELRHIICHEAPSYRGLDFSEVGSMLAAAANLTKALDEILTFELYGKVPLTQTDMNIAAYLDYEKAESKLNAVLEELREQYRETPHRLKLLNASQRMWERYIRLQAQFVHDPVGGGTIGPLLRSNEMESLTKERLDRMEKFVGDEFL